MSATPGTGGTSRGSRSGWSMAGKLLVATPVLDSPDFRRSVVLLLDHTADTGAMGVVVNRPSRLDVEAVLPAWQSLVSLPGRLFQGGPVGQDSALGIARVPGDTGDLLGVQRLVGSVGVVDLDAPPEVLAGAIAGLRVFAGYAGWSAGQLEDEIEQGAWWVVDAEVGDAFSDRPQDLWPRVLRRQPGRLAWHATFPEDPSLN